MSNNSHVVSFTNSIFSFSSSIVFVNDSIFPIIKYLPEKSGSRVIYCLLINSTLPSSSKILELLSSNLFKFDKPSRRYRLETSFIVTSERNMYILSFLNT